jgi:hypothetical protein
MASTVDKGSALPPKGVPGGQGDIIPWDAASEIDAFKKLQAGFAAQFESAFPDPMAAKTVVIVPSLTLDQEILARVNGHVYYEERLLCLLMLLRMPRTHVVFVTSVPVDPVIVDYYLTLLPGVTGFHARQRLTLLSCYDASPVSLTQKILARPRLVERIRQAIPDDHLAHLSCFNVTALERMLAVRLGIPLYGCDPDVYGWGTKSRSRQLFRDCGLALPMGYEDIRDEQDIVDALASLREQNGLLKRAVIKMNDGFSGEGNALFSFAGAPSGPGLRRWLHDMLPRTLQVVAEDMNPERYIAKFAQMQGIVEEFIEGQRKTSPSVQCRINPIGKTDVISTHDQMLGGEQGQVFQGATFPASPEYAVDIGTIGKRVAEALRDKGALGRFSLDLISVPQAEGWKHYCIEINLRKGGTTHPYLMLQFLTEGSYDAHSGIYKTGGGLPRYYYATDNLHDDRYRGLLPQDLMDIAIVNKLHYDEPRQEGVMFHLIGALSQYGKLGLVCIGPSQEEALRFHRRTVDVLNGS